ncbi:hypothetical protein CYR75_06715 [Paracoccus jeotgali]|uniref:Uncharacterized protein n=1 Tax=Paracoccus jeotgali TaxID=2065379 RepID=A0A2K9MEC9_9RHOB|nr:hypothetical protein CYR75_06715 [Paracoccus jeotgali]
MYQTPALLHALVPASAGANDPLMGGDQPGVEETILGRDGAARTLSGRLIRAGTAPKKRLRSAFRQEARMLVTLPRRLLRETGGTSEMRSSSPRWRPAHTFFLRQEPRRSGASPAA